MATSDHRVAVAFASVAADHRKMHVWKKVQGTLHSDSNTKKISMLLFELSRPHEDFVLTIDLDQAFKLAAGFLELPCVFNRAAPAGGEGEMIDPVSPETFDQGFLILVAIAVCQVDVGVAASLHVCLCKD